MEERKIDMNPIYNGSIVNLMGSSMNNVLVVMNVIVIVMKEEMGEKKNGHVQNHMSTKMVYVLDIITLTMIPHNTYMKHIPWLLVHSMVC